MIKQYEYSLLAPAELRRMCNRTESDLGSFIERVTPVVEEIKTSGDAALAKFTKKFDGVDVPIENIRVTSQEIEAAFSLVPDEVIRSIEFGLKNVRAFHQAQLDEKMWLKEVEPGCFAGEIRTPIDRVALYVPRGKGSFPSTVIMLTVPAVLAEVPLVYLLTPPGPDGTVDAATLVAAKLAGVEMIFRAGGAQAVACAAYGTATIPKADKIVGPGSPWVMAAKRITTSVLDTGIPAGPSEAIIFADETTDPRLSALDLVIESEHGPDSSVFLVTTSRTLYESSPALIREVQNSLGDERRAFSRAVLSGERSGVVYCEDLRDAFRFINDYAPEHLEILCAEPFKYLHRVKNVGEVLLGPNTPLSVANYVLGPNAVLPTASRARTISALSVRDFVKTSSIGYLTREGFDLMAPHARILAEYEGFDAHALSLSPYRFAPGRRVEPSW